jgi:hypothetical protein
MGNSRVRTHVSLESYSAQRTFIHTWGHGGLATRESSSSDGAPPAEEPDPAKDFFRIRALGNSVNLPL